MILGETSRNRRATPSNTSGDFGTGFARLERRGEKQKAQRQSLQLPV